MAAHARNGPWLLLQLLLAMLCVTLPEKSHGCYIQGSDTGVCDYRIKLEPDYMKVEMPFCGPVVQYNPCVPERKPIPPDRNFNKEGRWVNHTTLTKDRVN